MDSSQKYTRSLAYSVLMGLCGKLKLSTSEMDLLGCLEFATDEGILKFSVADFELLVGAKATVLREMLHSEIKRLKRDGTLRCEISVVIS